MHVVMRCSPKGVPSTAMTCPSSTKPKPVLFFVWNLHHVAIPVSFGLQAAVHDISFALPLTMQTMDVFTTRCSHDNCHYTG